MIVSGVMSSKYKAISRKYRPQSFYEVVGQQTVVTTLKNAIKNNLVAHAYLFCGSRGIGKTTLARLFAKALNCQNLNKEMEPCNQCSSCEEIASCVSVDVIEIDGASNRGIDDIRKINETISYSPSMGKYKIYIIDEVHMLTKEAFNALLKTLEDPPEKVKFFFATTEPHKILPTIISRTQRFYLKTISHKVIADKLKLITDDLKRDITEDALYLIAKCSEGSLRDAQSLLDQILCFQEGKIEENVIFDALGMFSREIFFELDKQIENQNTGYAFELIEKILSQGKDLSHFIQELIEHFRHILCIKTGQVLDIPNQAKKQYEQTCEKYSLDQCYYILDLLIQKSKGPRFIRAHIEMLFMQIIRSKSYIPLNDLIQRLLQLEGKYNVKSDNESTSKSEPKITAPLAPEKAPTIPAPKIKEPSPGLLNQSSSKREEVIKSEPKITGPEKAPTTQEPKIEEPSPSLLNQSSSKNEEKSAPKTEEPGLDKEKSHYETLLRFSSIELEGTVKRGP